MDMITGHHVDKISLTDLEADLDLKVSYDFNEHYQHYLLTVAATSAEHEVSLTKTQARELRDFLNGLNLEGRG